MKRTIILLIIPRVLVFSTLTSQAAQPTKPPPPRLPLEETSRLAPQAVIAPEAIVPWSKLVFQSYRDDNWEIYLADGDGSNQTRLTNRNSSDLHPQLNRGSTRIVSASRPAGKYESHTKKLEERHVL